jgi:hypothetical protein
MADGNERFCDRFLRKPQGVTPQKTPFFIVTAVKTSNLTEDKIVDVKDSTRN